MSNQLFINATELYSDVGAPQEVKTIFQTTFQNPAAPGEVSGNISIIFRKNGNIVHAEFPPVEILLGASVTNKITSVLFVPVGLRTEGQVKLPIIIKVGSVISTNMGILEIDPADGRISITNTGGDFTNTSVGGMEPTDVTYVADDAN